MLEENLLLQHCGDDGSHQLQHQSWFLTWVGVGGGTWEELLPKFLKLLLKYFISKGAGGVDDASVVLLLYFLPLNLLFTICFFAFLIDELEATVALLHLSWTVDIL